MDVGKRIKLLREKRGIQQLELANKINISQSKMNKIETGYQKKLEPDILSDVARSLGVSVDFLLNGEVEDEEEVDFQLFINDPELQQWYYKELPESDEDKIRQLRKMWEIMKDSK